MAAPVVEGHQAAATAGASASLSASISSLAGEALVVVLTIRTNSTQNITGTLTDSAGNTYTLARSTFQSTNRTEVWYCLNPSPVTSVTLTPTAAAQMVMDVIRVSGVDTSGIGATSTNNGANTTTPSATITTTVADSLVIGGVGEVAAGTATLDAGIGYTTLEPDHDTTGSGGGSLTTATGSFASPGVHNITWTNDSQRQCSGAAAEFLPAPAGGTTYDDTPSGIELASGSLSESAAGTDTQAGSSTPTGSSSDAL